MLKSSPNREMYIAVLRRMTPAERLKKSWELTQAVREMTLAGLRRSHPEASDAEIWELYLLRIKKCHNRSY
jgi:hypothetical protein